MREIQIIEELCSKVILPTDKVLHLLHGAGVALHEVAHHIDGQGEDDGAVLLGRDAGQRLQVPGQREWRLEGQHQISGERMIGFRVLIRKYLTTKVTNNLVEDVEEAAKKVFLVAWPLRGG